MMDIVHGRGYRLLPYRSDRLGTRQLAADGTNIDMLFLEWYRRPCGKWDRGGK